MAGHADRSESLAVLGGELRSARRSAGLSGSRLAALAGVPQPTVSRVETGNRIADLEVVLALIAALSLDGSEHDRLADLARVAYGGYPGVRVDAGVSFRRGTRARLTRHARVIRSFESVAVPILLRTPAYQDAAGFSQVPGEQLDPVADGEGRSFTFVMAGAVLRTWPGSGECMRGQLGHLLEAADYRGVRLGVLPPGLAGAPPRGVLPVHGFTLYDDEAVSVETFTRELTLTADRDVRTYMAVFDSLERAAAFGAQARQMIKESLRILGQSPAPLW